MKRGLVIIIHFLFWFLTLLVGLLPLFTVTDPMIVRRSLIQEVFIDVFCVGAFYISYFFVTNLLLKRKTLLFIVVFIIFVAVYSFIIISIYHPLIYKLIVIKNVIPYAWWYLSMFSYNFVYALWGTMFRFTIDWFKTKQKQKELEKQNISSELALLRSQINPHFLFNTLNNINSFVEREPEKASYGIVKLSEIMRYMLNQANTDKIPLDYEINYIKSYIDLQKLRVKDANYVSFAVHGATSDINIPPMLLMPFVENAFKHGKKHDVSPGIIIDLKIDNANLEFEVSNYIMPKYENAETEGGFGLKNILRRLELIYNDSYKLDIKNDNEMFVITLKIHNLD
jgi:sensor histidine kinase YesM